ncbi:hypothetical protein F2P79_021235 [Pimephales promelas]|nr:hypothetical protein F2P79_021235 [Pimephales promelas]
MCNGHAAAGSWTGPQRLMHINCLELLAVRLALHRFRALLRGQHVLVRSDNTTAVAYINHQGGLRSRRLSQLARHLLLWSQKHLRSLRAVYIPGDRNLAADELSRVRPISGEWRLHPQSVQLVWDQLGEAQIDLFASRDSSHCAQFYSLTDGTLGSDALAHSWPRGPRKYAFPTVSLLARVLCKIKEDEEQGGLPPLVPSGDLSVDLSALQRPPLEPLQSTALLIALVSIRRVKDLHALSVDEVCLEFGPAYSHVFLRPRPGYMPKVPTTQRDLVVNLQALPLEEAVPALALLCPVRALRTYVDRRRCSGPQTSSCLSWGEPEGKGSLKATAVPLVSGRRCFVLPAARPSVPPWCDGPFHSECGLLLGSNARRLANRHLQNCRLGDTKHLRKILICELSQCPLTYSLRQYWTRLGVFACSPLHSSDWISAIFPQCLPLKP